jgi:hypothetical protein
MVVRDIVLVEGLFHQFLACLTMMGVFFVYPAMFLLKSGLELFFVGVV